MNAIDANDMFRAYSETVRRIMLKNAKNYPETAMNFRNHIWPFLIQAITIFLKSQTTNSNFFVEYVRNNRSIHTDLRHTTASRWQTLDEIPSIKAL